LWWKGMTRFSYGADPEGGSNGMAIGEQLGEVSGRITGTRVLVAYECAIRQGKQALRHHQARLGYAA